MSKSRSMPLCTASSPSWMALSAIARPNMRCCSASKGRPGLPPCFVLPLPCRPPARFAVRRCGALCVFAFRLLICAVRAALWLRARLLLSCACRRPRSRSFFATRSSSLCSSAWLYSGSSSGPLFCALPSSLPRDGCRHGLRTPSARRPLWPHPSLSPPKGRLVLLAPGALSACVQFCSVFFLHHDAPPPCRARFTPVGGRAVPASSSGSSSVPSHAFCPGEAFSSILSFASA